MMFALAPFAYAPSYHDGESRVAAPIHADLHLTEMRQALSQLADVAVQREVEQRDPLHKCEAQNSMRDRA